LRLAALALGLLAWPAARAAVGEPKPSDLPRVYVLPSGAGRVTLTTEFPDRRGDLWLLVDSQPHLSLSVGEDAWLELVPAASDERAQAYFLSRGRRKQLMIALSIGRLIFVDLGPGTWGESGPPRLTRLSLLDGGIAWLMSPEQAGGQAKAFFSISGKGVYRSTRSIAAFVRGRPHAYWPGPSGELFLRGINLLNRAPRALPVVDYLDSLGRVSLGPLRSAVTHQNFDRNFGEEGEAAALRVRLTKRSPWDVALAVRELGSSQYVVGYPNGAVAIAGDDPFEPRRILVPAVAAHEGLDTELAPGLESFAPPGRDLQEELVPSVQRDQAHPLLPEISIEAAGSIHVVREGARGVSETFYFDANGARLWRPSCHAVFSAEPSRIVDGR
jgi:hypothetical protein